eukprot:scaffold1516_cov266-Prasinococcus_capsulatus_cf.AAC.6
MARTGNGESLFSALKGGTTLRPHCGSTNARLTCHLGLVVPPGPKVAPARSTHEGQQAAAAPTLSSLPPALLSRSGLAASGARGRPASASSSMTASSMRHVPETPYQLVYGALLARWRPRRRLTVPPSQVRHEGQEPRIVLLVNFWHPVRARGDHVSAAARATGCTRRALETHPPRRPIAARPPDDALGVSAASVQSATRFAVGKVHRAVTARTCRDLSWRPAPPTLRRGPLGRVRRSSPRNHLCPPRGDLGLAQTPTTSSHWGERTVSGLFRRPLSVRAILFYVHGAGPRRRRDQARDTAELG